MFKPIALHLIEEGKLLKDADDELRELARQLLAFAQLHGPLANKAKATLSLEIEIQVEGDEDPSFAIFSKIKTKLPGRPVKKTLGVMQEDSSERPRLVVPAAGTHEGNAYQRRLFNTVGQPLHPDTQEVLDDEDLSDHDDNPRQRKKP